MKNLNDNILCAVDIATTGLLPFFHDVIEISIVPMHGLKPDKTLMPFNMYIQPRRPENLTQPTRQLRNTVLRQHLAGATDPYTAMTVFEQWYERLQLRPNKRIVPLSFAWHTKAPFLMDWMCSSDDGDPYFYDHFHKIDHRDLLTIMGYWNDFAHCKSEHFPFTKQRLHFVAQKMGVQWVRPSTTLSRCFTMIESYQKLMELKLPAGIDLPFNFPMPIDYSVEDEVDELDE